MLPSNIVCKKRSMLPALLAICCALAVCMFALAGNALAGGTPAKDQCGYPDNSNSPRSGVLFSESEVLRAFSPASGGVSRVGSGLKIRMWYTDEHALTLGVSKVIVQSSAGATVSTTPYTIETPPTTSSGGAASNAAGIHVG